MICYSIRNLVERAQVERACVLSGANMGLADSPEALDEILASHSSSGSYIICNLSELLPDETELTRFVSIAKKSLCKADLQISSYPYGCCQKSVRDGL